jgi:hypothetical protein
MNVEKSKTALEYLDGMPPMMMMVVEARLMRRLEDYEIPAIVDVFSTDGIKRGEVQEGTRPYTADERATIAHWILHRMMTKRINDGRQFDSILECSRRAFATAMFTQMLSKPLE